MIACRDITFQYAGAETPLFENLDVTIDKPGFHALFGPSGVGKTTLAKIISGDIANFSGQVQTIGERPCLYTHNRERLPGWSPVGRHLEKTTPAGRQTLKDELIHHFGLSKLMGMRFSQLSMGQANRINLLRYLLQDFGILIMDESLANVDEPTRHTILYRIKSTFPEVVFVYISHNVMEVSRFCKQIIVFRGANQSPQTCRIDGQDHRMNQALDKRALEQSMLEIINAA
ncbi:ATP-binding cassette domain-containing protein [Desulfosarcina sp.]|jgi:ABC-type nitrate/sulfonate/bicarbonate transport system ATPase subunit|uniref:ATP-binding cassette domain-containing protein n=1 Tax=Desulfosarcina sp. TaxID=2027861 RepID=UPI0039707FD5